MIKIIFFPSQQFHFYSLTSRSFFSLSCAFPSQQKLPPITPEKRIFSFTYFTFSLTIKLHFSLKINFKLIKCDRAAKSPIYIPLFSHHVGKSYFKFYVSFPCLFYTFIIYIHIYICMFFIHTV